MNEMVQNVLNNPLGQGLFAVVGIAGGTFIVILLAKLGHALVDYLRPKAKATPTELDDRALEGVDKAIDHAEQSAIARLMGIFGKK